MHSRAHTATELREELPRESIGELVGQLAGQSSDLVRDELQLARQELTEKVTALRGGAILLGVGLSTLLLGLGTLTAAAVIGLGTYIGPGSAALLIGLAIAVIAGVLSGAGVSRLKRTSLKPVQTIETLRENKEWLKELT
jgi:uncharacterized membrane protein YqjE